MVRFLVVRTDDKVNVFSAVVAFNTVSIGDFAHGVGVSKIVIDELKKITFFKNVSVEGRIKQNIAFSISECLLLYCLLDRIQLSPDRRWSRLTSSLIVGCFFVF